MSRDNWPVVLYGRDVYIKTDVLVNFHWGNIQELVTFHRVKRVIYFLVRPLLDK